MPCSICNDARSRDERETGDVPFLEIEHNVKKCQTCWILFLTLQERKVKPNDRIRIGNDFNTYHSRCTYGIHVLINKDGAAAITDDFVMRNLRGKSFHLRMEGDISHGIV